LPLRRRPGSGRRSARALPGRRRLAALYRSQEFGSGPAPGTPSWAIRAARACPGWIGLVGAAPYVPSGVSPIILSGSDGKLLNAAKRRRSAAQTRGSRGCRCPGSTRFSQLSLRRSGGVRSARGP
jgi:hypothetical protein